MIGIPGSSYRGLLPPLTSEEALLRDVLRRDVEVLAGDIGERNLRRSFALEAAGDYIERSLRAAGYVCTRQMFDADGRRCSNVIAVTGPSWQHRGIVIIGAHYDTVVASTGANDDASGLDYDSLTRVVGGLKRVIEELVGCRRPVRM